MALDSTAARARTAPAPDPAAARAQPGPWRVALRTTLWAVGLSRLLVLDAGVVAVFGWGLSPRAADFDPASLTHGFGAWGDALTGTLARWDSTWFLDIARHGYEQGGARAAFFPLYPLLVRAVGVLTGSLLAAGVVISLACLVGASVLLHRLTSIELGPRAADATVWLLALSPMSFFLSAVYSESLFLLLSVGALYAARTDRWAWAGSLGALAALTRSAGIVLLVPIVLLWWRRHRRPDVSVLWLLALPLAVAGFCAGFVAVGLPFDAPFAAQHEWMRQFGGPFVAVRDGAVAAFDGARQLASGQREHVYFAIAGGDPMVTARISLSLFAFLVLGVVATAGVLRRLPLAYGAYVVAALAMPLSYPVAAQPLMSLPRFELALFPLLMWGGSWLTRPGRAHWVAPAVLGAGAVLLVAFTAQFATWHWVA